MVGVSPKTQVNDEPQRSRGEEPESPVEPAVTRGMRPVDQDNLHLSASVFLGERRTSLLEMEEKQAGPLQPHVVLF